MSQDFSPQQSIQVIENMINRTRDQFQSTNKYFLVWGVLITLASLSQYLLIQFTDYQYNYLPWFIFPILGYIWTVRISIREEKKGITILGNAIKWIWIGLGIGFILTFISSWFIPFNISPFMMLLSGVGTFSTSRILHSKPYLLGSIFLFITAIACLYFMHSATSLLLVAMGMTLGYTIPAILESNTHRA